MNTVRGNAQPPNDLGNENQSEKPVLRCEICKKFSNLVTLGGEGNSTPILPGTEVQTGANALRDF